jgi:hypothetical protein
MKQAVVYLKSGSTIILNEVELKTLMDALSTVDKNNESLWFMVSDNIPVLHWQSVECIFVENDSPSKVITSPTPQELRAEREKAEQVQPVTLDDQLSNPEVGK